MLTIKARANPGGVTHLALAGDLNEEADLGRLLAYKGKSLVLDVGSVRRINSIGVKDWRGLVSGLQAPGQELIFESCSVPFVNQMNMISDFCGQGRIVSFYVPFTCRECGNEHDLLWDRIRQGDAVPEVMPCAECRGEMEMDEMPDVYLQFLSTPTRT